MLKGLAQIRESLASRAVAPTGGVPELVISSGEVALMHFLTDRDDIIEVRYHRVPEQTTGGFIVTREKLCRQDLGETCGYCAHPSEDVRRRTLRWYAWVYAYCILTPNRIEGAETITRGIRTLYMMKLDAPAVLRKGEGNNKYLVQQLLSHGERYGSLCDRIYEWERTGATRNDTTYMLSPLPEIVAKPAVEGLASLEEIITKELYLSPFPPRRQQPQAIMQGAPVAALVQPVAAPGSSVSKLMDLLRGKQDKPRL